MVSVKLFVEGDGDSEALQSRCREGFNKFLEKAGFNGRMPRIVASGSRQAAYKDFKTSIKNGEKSLLLIDSEDCIADGCTSPWSHLANRQGDGFDQPDNATDDHCHFMVVCMESWFLADKNTLAIFFGQGFRTNALPQNSNIEMISKKDIFEGLKKATSNCKTKTTYGKSEHSFKILAMIDPYKVSGASPWAKRFLEKLEYFLTNY